MIKKGFKELEHKANLLDQKEILYFREGSGSAPILI